MGDALESFFPGKAPPPSERTPSVDQFYLSGEDNLRVTVFHRFAFTPRVDITWRLYSEASGQVVVNRRPLPTVTYPTGATVLIRLEQGVLLNVRVAVPAGLFSRLGTLYARAEIVRGLTGAVEPLATILQGYFASQSDLAWPGSPIQHMHEGKGFLLAQPFTSLTGPLRLSLVVEPAVRWRIISGSAVLTTSATAGGRNVAIEILDAGGNTIFQSVGLVNHTAGFAARHSFGSGLTSAQSALGGEETIAFPGEVELPDSAEVVLRIVGEQAGDTFTDGRALVREWMDL